MTEILISLSLLMLITVADLRLMTVYLQADKANYYRTETALRKMSLSERQSLAMRPTSQSNPVTAETLRKAILMSGH